MYDIIFCCFTIAGHPLFVETVGISLDIGDGARIIRSHTMYEQIELSLQST